MTLLTGVVPDLIIKKEVKDKAFGRAVKLLSETYEKHGWTWEG